MWKFAIQFEDIFDKKTISNTKKKFPFNYIWGFAGTLPLFSDKKLKSYKKWLNSYNIKITQIHHLFGEHYDFGDKNLTKRFCVVTSTITLLYKLKLLDVEEIVIHCSGATQFNTTKEKKEHTKRLKDSISYILPIAEQLDIQICLENSPYNSGIIGEAQELLEILKDFSSENIGICFDTGHANTYPDPKKEFYLLKDKIKTFHLHDNDGKRDLHLIPPLGTFDWKWFINELKKLNWQKPLPIEIYPYLPPELEKTYNCFYKLFNRPKSKFIINKRVVSLS